MIICGCRRPIQIDLAKKSAIAATSAVLFDFSLVTEKLKPENGLPVTHGMRNTRTAATVNLGLSGG
jgi:hypothetical protein